MNLKPLRVCKGSRCVTLTREGRCDTCKQTARSSTDKTYDRDRGSAHARGYGGTWPKIRRAQLNAEPFCAGFPEPHCDAKAEDVDHIIPMSKGGTNAKDNLQSLCRSCHNKKTAQETREKGKR